MSQPDKGQPTHLEEEGWQETHQQKILTPGRKSLLTHFPYYERRSKKAAHKDSVMEPEEILLALSV